MERPDFIPQEYDFAINKVISNFETMNGPRFKGYIKIIVRPAGTRSLRFAEIYCTDKDHNSRQRIFNQFCELLRQAKNEFGARDFIFEIVNKRGDLLKEIRLNVARKIQAVVPPVEKKVLPAETKVVPTLVAVAPEKREEPVIVDTTVVDVQPRKRRGRKIVAPVVEEPIVAAPAAPAPVPEPVIVVQAAAKLTKTERNAVPQVSDAPFELVACPNPADPIDFGLIKFWPNDLSSNNIKKVFGACGIETFQQMFELLGTFEPTKIEWEKFIQKLQAGANAKGIKLGSSAEGTLYWWLGKNKRWIRPYTVPARSR